MSVCKRIVNWCSQAIRDEPRLGCHVSTSYIHLLSPCLFRLRRTPAVPRRHSHDASSATWRANSCLPIHERLACRILILNCEGRGLEKSGILLGSDFLQPSCLFNRFEAQWLLYLPHGRTLKISAFCPHSVCMCLVLFSKLTMMISVQNIHLSF